MARNKFRRMKFPIKIHEIKYAAGTQAPSDERIESKSTVYQFSIVST